MDSPTRHDQCQTLRNFEEIDALYLYSALEHLTDQRQKRGVRYPLALILSLVVLGKLTGMPSLAGIAAGRWKRSRQPPRLPVTILRWVCSTIAEEAQLFSEEVLP